MALRGAQQMVHRLLIQQLVQQQGQPAALLDRCVGGAAQLRSASAHWQVRYMQGTYQGMLEDAPSCGCSRRSPYMQGASAALTVLWSRSLHSSAVLRADGKDGVDAANQVCGSAELADRPM